MAALFVALLAIAPPPPQDAAAQACRRAYGMNCADASRPLPSSPGFQPYLYNAPVRCRRSCLS